jgi:polyphosphate kinase
MPRNLERRVELMFPILDEKIRMNIIEILNNYFLDNSHAHTLDNNGNWTRLEPVEKEKKFRVQRVMLKRAVGLTEAPGPVKLEYNVRRSASNSPLTV